MAYIDQDKKAELAVGIKAVLKKYGMRGTISIRHHMALVVTVKSGSLDIIGNWYETGIKNGDFDNNKEKPTSLDVNYYYIEEHYTGLVKDFLLELKGAMLGCGWYDNSDIMSDYFDTAWYIDINIGKWDKPYEFER